MKQHNHPVAFEFSNGRAVIKAEADGTQAQAELPGTRISGEARTVSFDHVYLTQYAKSLEAENPPWRAPHPVFSFRISLVTRHSSLFTALYAKHHESSPKDFFGSTTMIYTHVLNRGPGAVRSPVDRIFSP